MTAQNDSTTEVTEAAEKPLCFSVVSVTSVVQLPSRELMS